MMVSHFDFKSSGDLSIFCALHLTTFVNADHDSLCEFPFTDTATTNECVAYPRYKAYWSYGDCGETYVAPNDFEACCEAAMAERENGRDIDRFSFVMSSGRCYFKCGGNGAEGEGYRDYPGFTEDDGGDWRSSQENALPECGCSPETGLLLVQREVVEKVEFFAMP